MASSPLAGPSSAVSPQVLLTQQHQQPVKTLQPSLFPPTGAPSASQSTPTVSTFAQSGSVVTSTSAPVMSTTGDATDVPAEMKPTSQTFDPYDTFSSWPVAGSSSSWPQSSSSGYMDIDSIGENSMPFSSSGISVDPITGGGWGSGGGPGTGGGGGNGMDIDTGMDDIFTDADFDFFDAPKPPGGATSSSSTFPPAISTGLTPNAGPSGIGLDIGMSPTMFGDTPHLPGPGPPSATNMALSHSSPWPPSALAESFATPHGDGHLGTETVPGVVPELAPPSPTKSTSTYSAPMTPIVHIALEADVKVAGPKPTPSPRGGVFDAIPFAPVHKVADGKYTAGKFALPSPPPEDDKIYSFPPRYPSSRSVPPKIIVASVPSSGWARRYADVTDPRVALVKRLVGVRRKSADAEIPRRYRSTPFASRANEEWEADVLPTPSADDVDMDDVDSDDDQTDEEDGQHWGEDEETLPGTRPSTPAPSYLPLGPTLLHTYFNHSELLSLSSPLKTPGTVASPPPHLTAGAGPMSVPTPVSPAAVLGAASEKSKSLEAAAGILAKEVVESSVWDAAWRSNAVDQGRVQSNESSGYTVASPPQVWQSDIKRVLAAFRSIPNLEAPLDLKSVFQDTASGFSALSSLSSSQSSQSSTSKARESTPHMEPLEPMMFSVGKGGQIVQVLPTALKFWEKLGLEPRSGRKDVVAFVFYEEDADEEMRMEEGEERVSDIETTAEKWLSWMGTAYMVRPCD